MSSIYFLHVVGIIKTTKVLSCFFLHICDTRKGKRVGKGRKAGDGNRRKVLARPGARAVRSTAILSHVYK